MKMNSIAKMFLTLSVAALPLMFAVSCEKETTTPINDSTSDPVVPVNPPDDPDNPGGSTETSPIPTSFPTKHISKVVCQRLNSETMEPEWEDVTDYIWEGDHLYEIRRSRSYTSEEGEVVNGKLIGYRFEYENGKVVKMSVIAPESYSATQAQMAQWEETTYEYDANGRLACHNVPALNVTVAYSYINANQVKLNLQSNDPVNFTYKWTNGNVTRIDVNGSPFNAYSYTNNPNPFYFPIHVKLHESSISTREDITAQIDMPYWSMNCANATPDREWQWTFGDDGYPTELLESRDDGGIRNRYTFIYAN